MLPWVDLDIIEIAFFYTSAMADPVTIQDIYDLFRASQVEWDRRAAEADRRAAEADRRAAEAKAEADRRFAELERIAANTSREVAGLTTRWGQFVENLVEPAVIRLFQARGIDVQETFRRMKSKRPGAQMEIDTFAVDGDVAVAIEVKSRLSQRDVDEFLAKLGRFRQAFPTTQTIKFMVLLLVLKLMPVLTAMPTNRGYL
jgi:hypothetical protein